MLSTVMDIWVVEERMEKRKMSGLSKRSGFWHIDKKINGVRICESAGIGGILDRIQTACCFSTNSI